MSCPVYVTSDLASNTITIVNGTNQFELLTDEQALTLAYAGIDGIGFPLNSVNTMINNTEPRVIHTYDHFKSNYIYLLPIRNLYIISNTLGTSNSMSVNGDWGILKTRAVSASYSEMIYYPTVIGMDYLDCSNQTLSRIDFKIKDHAGNIVNLHNNHVSFSIIFVKVTDE